MNEQIVELTERFRAQLPDVDLVCECATASCTSTIRIEIEEFSRIERAKDTFLVMPGHEDVQVEDVIARNGRFLIVQKSKPTLEAVG